MRFSWQEEEITPTSAAALGFPGFGLGLSTGCPIVEPQARIPRLRLMHVSHIGVECVLLQHNQPSLAFTLHISTSSHTRCECRGTAVSQHLETVSVQEPASRCTTQYLQRSSVQRARGACARATKKKSEQMCGRIKGKMQGWVDVHALHDRDSPGLCVLVYAVRLRNMSAIWASEQPTVSMLG